MEFVSTICSGEGVVTKGGTPSDILHAGFPLVLLIIYKVQC